MITGGATDALLVPTLMVGDAADVASTVGTGVEWIGGQASGSSLLQHLGRTGINLFLLRSPAIERTEERLATTAAAKDFVEAVRQVASLVANQIIP